ncbi:MAG: urea carboxylase-associated protein 2 [Marmoricola sp.]|nr:urea carboxylase-associated protein 2 [Marmoricola sp.]
MQQERALLVPTHGGFPDVTEYRIVSRGYTHDVPGDAAWSTPLRAGRHVTLTSLGAGANASVLLFGPDRLDRLNVPDTLKAQLSACIRPPMVLMSDRGLALASVVASTLDWHDCLTGFVREPLLVTELAKHGLGEHDLHGSVNFFSRVTPAGDERGTLTWSPGHGSEGDSVTLRTELDLLLVLSTSPHPLAPAGYEPAGVRVEVAHAPHVDAEDASVLFRPESARALEMSRRSVA